MFQNKQNVFDDFFAAARIPHPQQIHIARAFRHPRPLQRRPAHGRRHDPAPRPLRRHLVRLSPSGHAPLPEIRVRPPVDHRIRQRRKPERLRLHREVLALPEREARAANYPAIMFFTGDNDTRVDPMNARKMTALMQASSGSDRPISCTTPSREDTAPASRMSQLVEDYTDEMALPVERNRRQIIRKSLERLGDAWG